MNTHSLDTQPLEASQTLCKSSAAQASLSDHFNLAPYFLHELNNTDPTKAQLLYLVVRAPCSLRELDNSLENARLDAAL